MDCSEIIPCTAKTECRTGVPIGEYAAGSLLSCFGSREQHASLWMAPSQQRFYARNPSTLEIELRLIVQAKLVFPQGTHKFLSQSLPPRNAAPRSR